MKAPTQTAERQFACSVVKTAPLWPILSQSCFFESLESVNPCIADTQFLDFAQKSSFATEPGILVLHTFL
jgi:hypothetical protein